jgi:hypothetical protein
MNKQQKKKAPASAPARRQPQPQHKIPRHVPTGEWVLGRSNVHPANNSPTASGTQLCRTQHVYNRFVQTSSTTDGLACFVMNPTMSFLTDLNGVAIGTSGQFANVFTSAPATINNSITDGIAAQTLVGQYEGVNGLNPNNGTGFSRLLGVQISYKLLGTVLNEGGIAFWESGSAGRSCLHQVSNAAQNPVLGTVTANRMSMPFSAQCPLSNKTHTLRMVPTLPDNQKFVDIPEELDEFGNWTKFIPDHANDFADRSWNLSLVCQTAVPSQKIEFQVDAWYESYYVAPKGTVPLVPNTHVSLSDPVRAAANANSAIVADALQLKRNYGGFVTSALSSAGKSILNAGMSQGAKMIGDLAKGNITTLLTDGVSGLRMLL